MLRSVCFLLLLLFSLSSSHDGKQLVLAEDELQDGSSLDCGGEPSCYRKGDPYNSNGSTIGSEIQTSRLLLMADLNGAASRGVLFPSVSYSQSRTLPSTIILSPAQNMLKNSKLASSANRSASVVESPSVFSGNLQNKGSNWPLSWAINTPQFCSLSPPSLAVQPSVHPPTLKHFFSKLVLDHMSHLGTPKYCVPPVFLQGINSRSLIRRAHVHNVPPFRSSHQEANHNGAPYFLISPSSLTTGKMKPIEAAFSAYDSVRSGASLPLTHYRQSQESLRFGKYTRSVLPSYALPVFAPSLVPMHYGQPQDPPSQRVQAPENQPSVRLLPPSNGWPLKALSPVASDGEPARGPFLNENQPPKALPPTLASLGPPTVTSPHLLSPDAEQYQMHPSAFHPVMPNPSNHTKWLSPRVLGTPSQLQPPVEHTRTSVSPSGPVASPPRILPNETSRKESSMPIRALPRTRSRRQAPIAAPYNNQEPFSSPPASIPSQPLPKNPRTAELAPSIKFVSPPYQQGLRGSVSSPHASPPFESPPGNAGTPAFTPPFKGTISSPTSLPSEPPEAAPSIIFPSHEHHHNMRAWPKNISKGQAPVALAPKIQGHVIPPVRQPSRSPMEYPGRPESAPSIAFNSPQYSRDENVQGPVASSPSIFPSVPRQKKPSIPVAAQPRNRNPVALAPKNQVPVTPISLPSKAPVEYPGTPEEAPLIRFHFPPRNRTGKGPASPPRLSPSISHRPRSIIPVANQPRKGSWRHSPAITAPIIQGSVSSPLITPPPEQPNSRTIIAPSIVFPSPSHYPRVKGHLTPPGNSPSEPPQKKLRTPVAPPPRIRSWSHAPAVIPPTSQGPSSPPHEHYRRYSGVPPFPPSITFPSPPYHQRMEGPVSAPTSIASSKAPKKTPNVPLAAPPSKRSWSHAPSAIPPINQGPVASAPMMFPSVPAQQKPTVQVAAPPSKRSSEHAPVASPLMAEGPVYSPVNHPLPSPSGKLRPPAVSPSIRFRSPTYHRHVKGPSASSAPAPSKISPTHHYWGMKGPFASTPRMVPSADSAPPQKKPSIPMAAPPSKRSLEHAPVASPLMAEGPVYSPVNRPLPSPSGNLRPPAVSPSIRFRSPTYHRHVKGSSASSAPAPSKISPTPHHYWGMKGPVASTPRMVPSADSAPPQKKPSIPMEAPPGKSSSKHAPVSSPTMGEGPIYSPVNRPLLSPSGNLRSPAVSPSIGFHSPPHHRHVKGPSVSSAPEPSRISPTPHHYWGTKGPVASTPKMIPSAPPQKKPSIPMAAPPSKSSSKHTPVASPTMGEVNHPLLSPSGNLRPPTISPSIGFRSPPHHRHVKGNLSPPAVSPSIMFPSPPNHQHVKGPSASPANIAPSESPHMTWRIPLAPPPLVFPPPPPSQGPVYSSVNHPLLSPSGNLRPPTISPSIGFRSPPHHRHVKGNLSPPAVSPSILFPSPPNHQHVKGPSASPANIAPSESPHMTRRIPLAPPPLVFPPPPPSQDCSSIVCTQPLTSTPPGAPCGCVYPMQVELELGVALYAFFPLVSELAAEIAAGTFLKQSQVRIMGANADTQDQEKTIVILDLVPLGEKFDNTTAFLIFERFWQKKVIINETLFSDYWVISVSYPGLPPPPPSAFSNANINGEPTNSSGPSKHEPLGVDINKRSKKMGAGIIAVVALSSAIGAVICVGAVLITLLKCKNRSRPVSVVVEPTLGSSAMKRSGGCGGSVLSGSMESSTSLSFASSMAPYTGSAKTITIAELERATDRFSSQNILGEGGFGRVYRGVLEDGTKVAVKVLTRDDQQGGREFIAEVEMLSRLHHRNLVKLIGICTEEHNRSLVYELIPNGSVESHLHGLDKERAPLDWDARIKIALGAARGLAYLHEDSSPRVIHRDFKASNILLEDDFTPKVSDFGLAKSASEEVSRHISTRVMGTFGYVAPEYAMTGHLLVKSDVYSYGVVLLELLTGRKPVDMSQPPGQENLVTWARPLLTSKEGLEALVDPALGSNLPFDNIARVAAIASMCVQPEVSHRPFMGEVVQALKLVCNDSDTSNGGGSGHFSQGGESNAHYTEVKDGSSQQWPQSIQYVPDDSSFVTIDYDSGPLQTQGLETERPLSASALLSTSGSLTRQFSGSFRRHSSSGPLRTNKSKKSWYGIRGLAGGSISEHGVTRHEDVHELWP